MREVPERAIESDRRAGKWGLLCHVYRADDHEGEPTETDEAVPVWTEVDQVPYQLMWESDRHWLPLLLDEKSFHGRFVFEGESMQWMDMKTDIAWPAEDPAR